MSTDNLIEVRPARPDEYDQLGQLCFDAYAASGHLSATDPYAVVVLDAAARARDAELLVALRDGGIVGTVTICAAPSPFAEISREGESEFRFLAVAPAAWRTGVGEVLVEACELRARERGYVQQVICVIATNESAHRLYRRLGFTRLPERDWQPHPDVHLQAYRRPVPYDS